MFRLIILVAIFFAVYPMIGSGYEQFMNDFDIKGFSGFVASFVDGIANVIDSFKS
jgi:hypothetical protein|tara:strand:- start:969 stop:1133 length:165 start_codon:yes stop_codon:yes gene_type:complete